MRADIFDFELPERNIALYPARPRDSARMLTISSGGEYADRVVRDLPSLFEPGEVLVVNESKVIPAALEGKRVARLNSEDVPVKINLIESLGGDLWRAFARPGRRLKPDDEIVFNQGELTARVRCKLVDGTFDLELSSSSGEVARAIQICGKAPLPPYIAERREYLERDAEDYQTIYAADEGSVAAPTAGLHFTPQLMDAIKRRGVEIAPICLHVGAGTFLPVKAENISDHIMHSERFDISEESARIINCAKERGLRVTVVGTTSLRALESASLGAEGRIKPGCGSTRIFITPGFQFQVVDRLLTNFHLPKSTLFMLVSAFSGLDCMQRAYRHAIESGYRFYSYGDASLLERADG